MTCWQKGTIHLEEMFKLRVAFHWGLPMISATGTDNREGRTQQGQGKRKSDFCTENTLMLFELCRKIIIKHQHDQQSQ